MDLGLEKRFARQCRGKAFLIRYAGDTIACFQYEGDARRFEAAMKARLAQFDLEVEPSKTATRRFGSTALREKARSAARAPTFSFLGFTHTVSRSRKGRFVVGRRTEGKRKRRKLKALNGPLRSLRHLGGKAMIAYVRRHLQGHIQYYGVSGNSRSVASYIDFASRYLFKWLNRRSQKRSLDWKRFGQVVRPSLPRARIVHDRYPMPAWMT